ncbi:MAG: Maf family protein [Pacificimonas sp.]|nr:Maf family protein [Pacificimonas sp.]
MAEGAAETPQLVLASTSASRRAILDAAGVPHEAVPPMVDEEQMKESLRAEGLSVRDQADALAEAKAVKISRKLPGALVLGGDQMLETGDGRALDKAADMAALKAQLMDLRGKPHMLRSAIVIAENGRAVWRQLDSARLWVRNFSEDWLDGYLEREGETLLWGVGGYRIEERGVQLFERVQGDQFTIRGLPLIPLLGYLRARGVMPA